MLSDKPDPREETDARVLVDADSDTNTARPPARRLSAGDVRAIVRSAQHLVGEVPRLLYKHRRRISNGVMWTIADATRALKADLEIKPRDPMRMTRLVREVEKLVDRHLGFARSSIGWEFAESLLIAFVIALFIRGLFFEAFQIPSGSMIPTLRVGDRIFVSKFVYGVDIPFTDIRVFDWRKPARGEVIVFEYPGPGKDHGIDFIKRVLAVPGDRVRLEDDRVLIDGAPLGPVTVLEERGTCHTQPGEECTWTAHHRRLNDRLAVVGRRNGDDCPCTIQTETAGNFQWTTQHLNPGILCHCRTTHVSQEAHNDGDWPTSSKIHRIGAGWTDNSEQFTHRDAAGNLSLEVPEGYVMVMGDNRDYSRDGREWGLVPLENIKGKALMVWWAEFERSQRIFRPIHKSVDR
ncbi:MAG: signal peptidase I [Myxococcota bacterium]|jgi:signal peptidase I